MAWPTSYWIRMAVNPANTKQIYTLNQNGLIMAHGEALPVPVGQDAPPLFDPPPNGMPRAVQFIIYDWTKPSGWTLDFFGDIYPWGGAPDIRYDYDAPDAPPSPFAGRWNARDFTVDPATLRGYTLRDDGRIQAFGGAAGLPAPNLGGLRTGRRIIWNWQQNRGYVMDAWGGLHAYNGAPAQDNQINLSSWKGWDICRDFVIADWNSGASYTMDGWGGLHKHNGAVQTSGQGPYWPGWDVARDLYIVRGGLPGQVLEFILLDELGALHRWVQNSPPSITISAPDDGATVATTRPRISWRFTDPDGHTQTEYDVRAYSGSRTNSEPLASYDTNYKLWTAKGNSASTRTVLPTVDFPRGQATIYVRAKDAADTYTPWDRHVVTIAPPVLNPPVIGTYSPAADGNRLKVTQPTDHAFQSRYTYEFTDGLDPWQVVRGGEEVEVGTTVIDAEYVPGVARFYRARQVRTSTATDAYNASEPGPMISIVNNTGKGQWTLMDVATKKSQRIYVSGEFEFTEEVEAGVFLPLGREAAVVVSDGTNKGLRADLKIVCPDVNTYRNLVNRDYGIARPGRTLLLRDGFGRSWYVQVTGAITHTQAIRGSQDQDVTIPITEVTRPAA